MASEPLEAIQRKHAAGEHLRGTVVERETFLERKPHRLQPRTPQRFRAGHPFTLVKRLAAAEQHDRQVRQWREIAARAHRPHFRNHRDHIAVQQFGERAQRRNADARMPAHQRVDADHEHRAHHACVERLADADRMGDHQVVLQFLEQAARTRFRIAARQFVANPMRTEQLVGVAAEPGGHAVDRFPAADFLGEKIRSPPDVRELGLVERDTRAAASRCDDLLTGQAVAIEKNCLHRNRISSVRRPPR